MTVIAYPALVTDRGAEGLQATFVDFAQTIVTAAEPVELIRLAREQLAQTLQALENEGSGWPSASSLAELKAACGDTAGSLIWVDVAVEDTPIRVTISVGERLLARIDAQAEAQALTRSGFLALAAKRQLAQSEPLGRDSGQRRLYEEVVAAARRMQETLGPESPVGRTLADLDAMALDGLRRMADGVSSAIKPRGMRGRARDVETDQPQPSAPDETPQTAPGRD